MNNYWMLGYNIFGDPYTSSTKAHIEITSSALTVIPETRKMAFYSSQATISDSNGNLLFYSNGCWIANNLGDTMLNGSGLSPGSFTDAWNTSTSGIPIPHGCMILPYPSDPNKYVMFHQTGNNTIGQRSSELYYTIIDMSLDNGKGGVIQKNIIAIHDTLGFGLAACLHGNGRDWWITAIDDSVKYIHIILFTPDGIESISTHINSFFVQGKFLETQPVFSPDGNKFAFSYTTHISATMSWYHDVRLYSFDRCLGTFTNETLIDLTDSYLGVGVSFSPNSKYLYATSVNKVFQLNADTSNVSASLKIVAINDNFYSPFMPFQTDFLLMYLAANGKIYITSGNGVQDMHVMEYPDSIGTSCNVLQHSLPTPCWSIRGNVYHPNYYLGPAIGSLCDSLGIGIDDPSFNFNFSVSPNPLLDGYAKISYLLPPNKNGLFQVYDLNGNKVYEIALPKWSNLQKVVLPRLASGIYIGIIKSDKQIQTKKIALIK